MPVMRWTNAVDDIFVTSVNTEAVAFRNIYIHGLNILMQCCFV